VVDFDELDEHDLDQVEIDPATEAELEAQLQVEGLGLTFEQDDDLA